jgi:hypothetical protein
MLLEGTRMTFDHDWWFGGAFERHLEETRRACTALKFPDAGAFDPRADGKPSRFFAELETRTVIYLRDGFSYELKRLVNLGSAAFLSFECVPTEESYKVGAFVVSVGFEEVCRVETFAVHPDEKPDETPAIKGFGGTGLPSAARGGEDRTIRPDTRDWGREPEPDDEDGPA